MYADAETGLYYNMARYYDPRIGRYISSDPIGLTGGLNTYSYVANNPLRWIDRWGYAPGDPYPTADIAGANAVNDINYKSIKENREYAGWVYQRADGTYSYTSPLAGTIDRSNPGPSPSGDTAGLYHTHGGNDPRYDNEHFSPQDINVGNNLGNPMYLGTPMGIIKKYDPKTRRIKNLPYPKPTKSCKEGKTP